jgi:prevent-host-death family protein
VYDKPAPSLSGFGSDSVWALRLTKRKAGTIMKSMKTVRNVAQAREQLSELIERVERVEEVVIERAGVEIARLVAANDSAQAGPRLGAWADLDIDLGDDPCAPEPIFALYAEQSLEDDLAEVDPIPGRFALLKANGHL